MRCVQRQLPPTLHCVALLLLNDLQPNSLPDSDAASSLPLLAPGPDRNSAAPDSQPAAKATTVS